jgi:predicted ribosomally synthesized peptide with nif11-like leader
MSMEALRSFLKKAGGDAELMKKVDAAIADQAGPDRLLGLGRENGFEFSAKEAVSFFYNAQNNELSEDDLAAVAGGVSGLTFGNIQNLSRLVPSAWFDRGRMGAMDHDAGPSF